MFIIKLGEEALNRLEEQLTVNCNKNSEVNKNINGNNLYSLKIKLESSILYQLLSCEDSSTNDPKSLLFPEFSKFESDLPRRTKTFSYSNQEQCDQYTTSPRPYSAPQTFSHMYHKKIPKRKQLDIISTDVEICSNKSFKISSMCSSSPMSHSPSISCSTDSLGEEPMNLSKTRGFLCKQVNDSYMADSWLFKMVFLINSTNSQFNANLTELPPKIRLHLLQSSWHRILITYLFEYFLKRPKDFSTELWIFIQSIIGIKNRSMLSKKNMSCLYKKLVDDIVIIMHQIRKLNLDDPSMNFLRIGLFLTGNEDGNNEKNLKLIELFIESKIEGRRMNDRLIGDLVDNLLKLNSVVIETVFYGHLEETVENVIHHLFTNSKNTIS